MSNKTELLRKLKKLANEGIGGEKVSAEKKLNELMNKYGISETELLEDKIETMEFIYHGAEQKRLLIQIIYKVANCKKFYGYYFTKSGRKSKISLGADVTSAQKIEIEFLFDFYVKQFEKERSMLMDAFIQKHRLFGVELDENDDENDEPNITPEEKMRIRKMSILMSGMEDVSPIRRLEGQE